MTRWHVTSIPVGEFPSARSALEAVTVERIEDPDEPTADTAAHELRAELAAHLDSRGSVRQMAKDTGLNFHTINDVIDEKRWPGLLTVVRLAHYCGLQLNLTPKEEPES